MNTGLVTLALYMIGVLGIAVYVSRNESKDIKEFTTTSSGLGTFILALTLSATYHSSYAFLGAPGFAYQHGIGWWANGIWTVFPGVLFWFLGRRYWYLGRKKNYLSMAQLLSDAYRSKVLGALITIITLIFTLPYVAIQAIGSGYIFETLTQGALSYEVGAILFLVIMILIVFIGGMKGVAVTDAAQGIFMWLGLVIGGYIILNSNFTSISEGYKEAYKSFPELFTLPGPRGQITPQDWISRWSVITIGMMMFPHITLRFFSARSLDTLKWSSVFSSIYLTSIYWFTPAIGILGNLMMPNLSSPDTIFPELLIKNIPIVFAAIIISGALAASMSTGDSQLHAVGSMLATDIYKPFVKKEASDNQEYKVAKYGVLILGVFSIVIALYKPGMLGDLLALSNGGAAVLAPTVIGALFWKKADKNAAIISIVIGEVILLMFSFVFDSPFGFMPAFWGMVISAVIYIIICIMNNNVSNISIELDEMKAYFE